MVEPVCPQIRLHSWGSKLGAKAEGQGPNFGVSDALTDLEDGGVRQRSQRRFSLWQARCLPAKQNRAASPPHYLSQKRCGATGT